MHENDVHEVFYLCEIHAPWISGSGPIWPCSEFILNFRKSSVLPYTHLLKIITLAHMFKASPIHQSVLGNFGPTEEYFNYIIKEVLYFYVLYTVFIF